MKNSDYSELFQSALSKCDRCNSKNLLLFTETRISDCVAWACFDCQHFEIRAKPEHVKKFFDEKNNETKEIS